MQIFKTSSIVLFRSALPQGIRAVCVSSALWLYSLVLAFTWFWAYRTPEWAVLVRIGASIFSDLIWIPLGITVWADMALMFVSFSLRLVTLCSSGCTAVNWVRIQKKQSCSLRLLVTMQIGVISAVSIFVLFYHNTAFKLFFIPAALFVIHTVIKLFRAPRLNTAFLKYIPALIAVMLTIMYYRWQLLPPLGKHRHENDIKVMTYNILGDADAKSRMKMFETIRRENPDVVCCMEYNHIKDNNLFKQQIGDLYPYIVSNRDSESWSSGELLLSKHPVTLKQNVLMPYGVHGTFDFLFAELSINGKKVNFVNVHLITVGHHVEDVARSIHSLRRNASNTFNKKINLASRFEKNRDIMKYNEAKSMLDYIKLFEDPTIICGDLNDTPNSRVYYLFSPRYVNAFSAAGWGFGDTFGELWIMKKLFVLLHRNERVIPFLFAFARDIMRIDHIFVSKDIEIIDSHAVKKAAGSDHKPVTAILRLK